MTTASASFSQSRNASGRRGPALLFDRRRADVAAFTLIELILALGIAAVVLTSISATFFGALRMRNASEEAASQTLPIDTAVSIMKRDLMAIMPPGVLAGPMGNDAVVVGMTQPLILEMFTASAVIGPDSPFGDMQKIDWYLQDTGSRSSGGGRELVRGVTRNLLAPTPGAPTPEVLLDGVQNLQFSYYDGTNWNDTWSITLSNIPVAIKTTITFTPPSRDVAAMAPVQFVVPVAAWAYTNSITNEVSN
jgi:type II secretion system protein J